ncbi:hypothetical protein ERD95_12300 [Enterobacteriaceae bacterium ML5]|nr:hypothetical protein ERD95_12300 [Enterobacteriaceae bacterium ML5]
MGKHYNGKNLAKNVTHNGIRFRMMVVKGHDPEHIPEDPEDKANGTTIHFSLARTKKEFDENLIEILNKIHKDERVLIICPHDVVFEYAYSRLKEL